jgi:hypothetical protein
VSGRGKAGLSFAVVVTAGLITVAVFAALFLVAGFLGGP